MHSVKISLRFETDPSVPTRQLAILPIPNCLQSCKKSNQIFSISRRYHQKKQISSKANCLGGLAMEFSSLDHVTIYFALLVQANPHPRLQVPKQQAKAQVKHLRNVKMRSRSITGERCALANGPATSFAERDSRGESLRESTTFVSSPVGNIVIPTKRHVTMWTDLFFAARNGPVSGLVTPGVISARKMNTGRRSVIIVESGAICDNPI